MMSPKSGATFWTLMLGSTFLGFIPVEAEQLPRRGDDYRRYCERRRIGYIPALVTRAAAQSAFIADPPARALSFDTARRSAGLAGAEADLDRIIGMWSDSVRTTGKAGISAFLPGCITRIPGRKLL